VIRATRCCAISVSIVRQLPCRNQTPFGGQQQGLSLAPPMPKKGQAPLASRRMTALRTE